MAPEYSGNCLCNKRCRVVVHISFTVSDGYNADSKVYGANMGPIWGRQDPGGPHGGPMNFFYLGIVFILQCSRVLFSNGSL